MEMQLEGLKSKYWQLQKDPPMSTFSDHCENRMIVESFEPFSVNINTKRKQRAERGI